MSDFKGMLSSLNAGYEALNSSKTMGNTWSLSRTMDSMEGALREHIQELTKSEITQIIGKLQSNAPLTPEEVEYVKLWIVGEAEYYISLENNYNEWLDELKRLVEEINKIDVATPDFKTSSKLRAMLLDGIRVLGDILFYLKQKERVDNFTKSTEEIDPQERDILVRLLQGKIESPNE